MYYLTVGERTIPHFNAFVSHEGGGKMTSREIFSPLHPFNLLFFTYHEDDADSHLIMSQVNPEDIFYFCIGREESALFFQHNKPHRHDFYELMFVIDGSIYQGIEHKRHLYPKGSCCLLNKNVQHNEEYSRDLRIVFLQFTADFIMKLLDFLPHKTNDNIPAYHEMKQFFRQDLAPTSLYRKKYLDFIPREDEAWICEHVHRCFENLLREMQSGQPAFAFRIAAIFIELLCYLFDSRYYQNTPVEIGSMTEKSLFDDITDYLSARNGRASRHELADHFHYSGDYLYKIVRKYTGLSLFDYSTKFCLKQAAHLLSVTDWPIQRIASELGFTNLSHFYRLYKEEYQTTPRAYRVGKALKE